VTRGRDDPVPLKDALAAVGRDLGVPDTDVHGRVVEVWREVVGSVVAEHALIRSVRDGVCTVAVDEPVWATQLRYLERGVLERVAAVVGPGIVESIKVVVAPPRGS
jgi:predicted nucleic acid-binding Zn ribbon protein